MRMNCGGACFKTSKEAELVSKLGIGEGRVVRDISQEIKEDCDEATIVRLHTRDSFLLRVSSFRFLSPTPRTYLLE